MPRGMLSAEGETNVAANGYHYTKTKDDGWRLTHHLVAERILGRPIDTSKEIVRFIDKDKTNFDPSNIEVIPKGKVSARKRLAQIEARIKELLAEKEDLERELGLRS